MPAKKGKVSKKRSPRTSEIDDVQISQIDIQYNPDIVYGLLEELQQHVDIKCAQIQKDSDFLCTSVQQAFHLELIKLPTQVKQMSVKRFKEEYGFSLEAVTKGAIVGAKGVDRSENSFSGANHRVSQRFFQTPASKHGTSSIIRAPREGEQLVSKNGSPLGEFSTVKKAGGRGTIFNSDTDTVFDGAVVNSMAPPPTPGVFVPLKTGEIIDLDSTDLAALPQEVKEETLEKMQEVMDNMKALMSKLTSSVV